METLGDDKQVCNGDSNHCLDAKQSCRITRAGWKLICSYCKSANNYAETAKE